MRKGLSHVANALLQRAFAVKQHLIGAPELVDRLMRKAAPLEADDIEPRQCRAIAERHAEGDEIVLDASEAADKSVRANPDELMRRGSPAHDGEVTDLAMACQHHVVRQDDALAEAAVV